MKKTKKKQKNRWKIPSIVGVVILSLIIVLSVIAVAINKVQNKQAYDNGQVFNELQTAVIQDGHQACRLSGGTIIDFGDRGMLSYRDQAFTKNANVPAGHYKVTLESYDGYNVRAQTDPAGQRHEQYRVKFRKGNEVVATSGVTTDLRDRVTRDRKVTIVNNDLKVAKNVDNLYVEHAFQHATGPNSLRAICMKLEAIPQPVNGQCGSAALTKMLYDSAPTKNLCAKGTPTTVVESSDSAGRVWSWTCGGINNGQSSPTCTAHGKALPKCGDGSVNQNDEECDKGANENGKVCTPTYDNDCTYCDANCKEKTVTAPKCGDGNIEPGHEQCDDGADKNGIVPVVGYGETKEYCKSDCTKGNVTGGQCDNGTIEGDEQCDDGADKNGQVCTPAYGESCTYCSDDCQNKTVKGSDCGDGTVNGDEKCDAGDDNGKVPTVSYGKTKTYCKSDCTEGAVVGGQCGNGTKEGDEQCDDGNNTNGDGCSSTCQTEKEPKKEKKESCNSSIGNYIWYDTNGNGVQEDIEEGISGIKVCAYKGDKKYCDTTDKHGRYKIKNLCAGKYEVKVKGVDKMTQTYDPDSKKDNRTKVKLKDNDKHTKADFGYRGKAPSTGFATNVALLIGLSTLITIGILLFMRKKGQI